MSNRIREIYLTFSGDINKKGTWWIADCAGLAISTCGLTRAEAYANMQNAIAAYLRTQKKIGNLEEVLHKCGLSSVVEVVNTINDGPIAGQLSNRLLMNGG